jgi:hypothetical protein
VVLANRAGIIDLPRQVDPLAPPDLDEKPHWLTGTQLKQLDLDVGTCRRAVSQTGLLAVIKPAQGIGTSCERAGTLDLARLSQARLKPEETRCNIAARLFMWEKHVVQPSARRYFNAPVAEILHFGSYSCRTIAGSRAMSEHANANAFDISGFRLANGRTITVLRHWNGTSAEAAFLRDVRSGACDYFNMTLSPDFNADHRDHFHLDMGWLRGCN